MRLVSTQYRESPLGNVNAKKPNIKGIIHSMILPICSCEGSTDGGWDIFCRTHILAPTRRAMKISPVPRSSQRKCLFNGTAS
jgi:hypothetical protein